MLEYDKKYLKILLYSNNMYRKGNFGISGGVICFVDFVVAKYRMIQFFV